MKMSEEITKAFADTWGVDDQTLLAFRITLVMFAGAAIQNPKIAAEVMEELPLALMLCEKLREEDAGPEAAE